MKEIPSRFRLELIEQIRLAFPVLLAQLAQMSLGVVDTIMTGQYGADDMAAVALAWAVWLPGLLFGTGMLVAVTPAVGQLRGAGLASSENLRSVVRQGVWLAIFLSIPLCSGIYLLSFHLSMFGLDTKLASIGGGYLRSIIWGGPAFLIYVALRSALEGFAMVRPAMFASFLALAANIPCNYAFIFGRWGAPELGGVGAGVASAITCWVMLLPMLGYAFTEPHIKAALSAFELPNLPTLRKIAAVGFPNALATLSEVGMFSVVTLMVAPLGAIQVAGHQVALNFSSIVFILPLSIGMTATIRVSNAIGACDSQLVKTATRTALGLGLGCALITAALTVLLRYPIANIYNSNPEVISLAVVLLLIDATYQCTDAIQVVSVGILRGYNDTRAVFFVTFVCFWFLTLPLAWVLGRTNLLVPAMGPKGLWLALVIGLSLAAACYILRIRSQERRLSSTSN